MSNPDIRPGGNYEPGEKIQLTPFEKDCGLAIQVLFKNKLRRDTPWMFKNGKVTISNPDYSIPEDVLAIAPAGFARDVNGRIDVLNGIQEEHYDLSKGLASKKISANFGQALRTVARVELAIPDYIAEGNRVHRKMRGITDFLNQWGLEEVQHNYLLLEMLKKTGSMTDEQIKEDVIHSQENRWKPPFEDTVDLVAYAYYQEGETADNYERLYKLALKEGNVHTAFGIYLIMSDENYHHGAYKQILEEMAKYDRQRARDAVQKVTSNFQMPAQKLFMNPRREIFNLFNIGVVSDSLVGNNIVKATNKLSFIKPLEGEEDIAAQIKELYPFIEPQH